jgi:hypothetical protein
MEREPVSTLNFRQFSKPEVLQQIDKNHLIEFFSPHVGYFHSRNIDVIGELNREEPNYSAISGILITSDDATPDQLAEALYYVNDVATEDGADAILDYLDREPNLFPINQDSTPADLALQLWMVLPDVLKRISGNLLSVSKRSYDYFQTSRAAIPAFHVPSEEIITQLEAALDDWFFKKLKGRYSKVICTPKEDYIWFMVRHGKRYSRAAVIDGGDSKSYHFRPEKHDVVVYNPANGELRVNAEAKGEIRLYREAFGLHIFGASDFFNLSKQFNLDPIRSDGEASILFDDIEEIEDVKLREVHIAFDTPFNDVKVFKSDNLFASMRHNEATLPAQGTITQIKFGVKFRNDTRPKVVKITNANRAEYKCNEHAEAIERWLSNRGFIVTRNGDSDE